MARDLASDPGADLSKTGDDVREALKNGRAALLRGRMGRTGGPRSCAAAWGATAVSRGRGGVPSPPAESPHRSAAASTCSAP